MNPQTNQYSYFEIVKFGKDFAIFLDEVAFSEGGIGEMVTIEEIAQLLGN